LPCPPNNFFSTFGDELITLGFNQPVHLMNPRSLGLLLALIASVVPLHLRADLFVAGNISGTIQRYDGVSGASEGAFVPGGQTYSPFQATGVTFGPDGNLYVVSTADGEVLRYNGTTGAAMPSPTNNPLSAEFSTGLGMSGAQFLTFGPDVLGNANADIYVSWQNNVNQYNAATGVLLNTFTLNSATMGSSPSFSGIAVGPNGNLYVADRNGSPLDSFANSIIQLNPITGFAATPTVAGGSGGLNSPAGLTFGPDGNLYVAGPVNPAIGGQVLRYSATGTFLGAFVSPGNNGGIQQPQGIVFGPDGNLYVASFFHNPATMFSPGTSTFVERYNGLTGAPMGDFADGGDMDAFFGLAFSNLVAVPEPSTVAAGVAATLGLLLRRRRR
jgi:glucose/arabinose dehydrogenase